MWHDVLVDPRWERRLASARALQDDTLGWLGRQRRWREIRADALDLVLGERQRAVPDARPVVLDLSPDLSRSVLTHPNLYARLELVVPSPEQVVDAQDRLDVREHV